MKLYFCCSDIHSFFYEWMLALDSHGFKLTNPEHNIIVCGDLLDRGNQSEECFNFVQQLSAEGRLIYVRGNHEDLLEDCVSCIKKFKNIGTHHLSNGTIKTIANIVGVTEYDVLNRTFDWNVFDCNINNLMEFIDNNCVDYFELGDTIFVHGWLPTTCDTDGKEIVHENWRDGGWNEAKWENGMEMFKFKIQPSGNKTVVCGHWHTSWGHHFLNNDGDEFSNHSNFNTFKKTNEFGTIIALDACTAFTHKVNCVVFNNEGEVIDA